MNLFSFDYHLPAGLIAQEPALPRDHCRLMVLDRAKNTIHHDVFYHVAQLLQAGDVLVLNRTKVIPARLRFFIKDKPVEIFLTRALNSTDWLALVHPGKHFKPGSSLKIKDNLSVEVMGHSSHGQRVIRFNQAGEILSKLLHEYGQVPLPPYILNSKATFDDYQTVFAQSEGSVAAPTASLHFTKELLDRLRHRGVQIEFVTLHVGIGTFLPIRTNHIKAHRMHDEVYEMDTATAGRLTKAKQQGRRLIAVGTTTVRVLESTRRNALNRLTHQTSQDPYFFQPGKGSTTLFIYPGYQWQAVDGLITNFHLPKSTLLLLTAAFGGYDLVMKAYQEAVAKRYKFYSFGDAMLIL